MRIRRSLATLASFLTLAVAMPSVAQADDQTGSAGAVTKVEINTPSADAYLQYHGRVYIRAEKTTTEYRWGGTSCGTRTVDTTLLNTLIDAAAFGSVHVSPNFQEGPGGAKCLVGFSLVPKR